MTRKVFQLILRYKHINWALLDQALVSGTNFFTVILIARYLGVEEFGVFSIAWMVVLFMNGLQTALIVSPMMSVGPTIEKEQQSTYYGAIFLQQFLLALFFSCSLFFGAKIGVMLFPSWGFEPLAVVIPVVSFFYLAQDFIRRYFFVLSKFKEVFISDVVNCLGRLVLLAILFNSTSLSVGLTFWIISAAAGIAWVISFVWVERLGLNWEVFRKTVFRHWPMSKWLVSSVVVQWLAGNLFVVAAAMMLGASAAGALKAMQNLLGIFNVLFSALENIVPVRAAVIYCGQGKAAFIGYLLKVAIWGGAVTLGCMVVVVVFSEYWVELFYGEEYLQHDNLLLGYGVVYLLTFVGLIFRIAFRTLEHTYPIFQGYFFSAIISLLSFYPFILLLGTYGAVIGLVIVHVTILMVYMKSMKKEMIYKCEK